MSRLSSLMVAVAATFAMSSAQALVVVVDDFNSPNATVFDAVGGDAAFATYADATRTIRHQMVTAGANATGNQSKVTLGGDSIPAGSLDVSNSNNVTSNVTLEWALGPFQPLTGPASLYFKVFSSDAVNKVITATAGIGNLGVYAISFVAAPGQTVAFALSDAEIAFLNGAGATFSLTLTGENGWDITLDEVGFQIPEPSVLGLAGLALVGAGLASRRRRA